jgi:hypothetical protein
MPPLKLLGVATASVIPNAASTINALAAQASTCVFIVNTAAAQTNVTVYSSATATSTTDTRKGSILLEGVASLLISKAAGDKVMAASADCLITPVAIGSTN